MILTSCGVSKYPEWAQWERAQQLIHLPKHNSTRTHLGNVHPNGWQVYQRKVINHVVVKMGPNNVHKKKSKKKKD